MSVVPGLASAGVAGKVTAPGAAGVIANTAGFVAGTYQVRVTVYIDGTTTAADDDNMRVTVSGTPTYSIPLIVNASTAPGSLITYTFWLFQTAASVISVQAIAAGGAAAVYHAQITYEPYVTA